VPVYEFLKEPLVRKFGADFYEALEATAQHLKKEEGSPHPQTLPPKGEGGQI